MPLVEKVWALGSTNIFLYWDQAMQMPLAWPLGMSQIQSAVKVQYCSDCLLGMLCYLLGMSPVDKLGTTEWTSLHSQPLQIWAVLLLCKVALHGAEQPHTGVPRVSGNTQNPGRIDLCLGGQDVQSIKKSCKVAVKARKIPKLLLKFYLNYILHCFPLCLKTW